MNLNALSILLTGLLAATATAQNAATGNVALPSGLDEEHVLGALVSDYSEKRLAASLCEASPDPDGCADTLFSLAITEVLELAPPVPGQRLVAVAANGREGRCNQCGTHYVGVFSLPSQRMVWSFGGLGYYGPAQMQIARPAARNGPAFLQFESAEGSPGGTIESTRYWIHPEVRDGVLSFTTVWSGISQQVETSRDLIHASHRTIGSPPRNVGKGRFEQVLSSFFAGDCDCPGPEDETLCASVEVRRILPFQWDGRLLSRISQPEEITRRDHCQSELFPFSLPVRSHAYSRRPEGAAIVPGSGTDGRRVDSPKGRYFALVGPNFQDPLVVARTRDGKVLRSVRLNLPPNFCGNLKGIGWSTDESRAFVAVEFAPDIVALLSFSVTGKRDYWEATLPTSAGYGSDGFLMAPRRPQPVR